MRFHDSRNSTTKISTAALTGRKHKAHSDLVASVLAVCGVALSWLNAVAARMATKWLSLGLDQGAKDSSACLGPSLPAANPRGLVWRKSRVLSILVRGLDQKTVQRLKERARVNGRSLQ